MQCLKMRFLPFPSTQGFRALRLDGRKCGLVVYLATIPTWRSSLLLSPCICVPSDNSAPIIAIAICTDGLSRCLGQWAGDNNTESYRGTCWPLPMATHNFDLRTLHSELFQPAKQHTYTRREVHSFVDLSNYSPLSSLTDLVDIFAAPSSPLDF